MNEMKNTIIFLLGLAVVCSCVWTLKLSKAICEVRNDVSVNLTNRVEKSECEEEPYKEIAADRMDFLEMRVNNLATRVSEVEDRANNFDDNVKVLLGEVYSRLDSLEDKAMNVETRMNEIENELGNRGSMIEDHLNAFADTTRVLFSEVNSRLDSLDNIVKDNSRTIDDKPAKAGVEEMPFKEISEKDRPHLKDAH